MLIPYLDCEVESEEKVTLKALEASIHGRAKGVEGLLHHIAESDNPLVKNKQNTTQTFTKWINECITMGRDEKSCLENDWIREPEEFSAVKPRITRYN